MKSVAIVGGGKTRKLAPWSDLRWEIWTLNEAAGKSKQRSEVVFQMHDPGIYKNPNNQTDPNHWTWLKQLHDNKIYMQKVDPEVPNSIEYPFKDIVKDLMGNVLQKGLNDRELKPVELFTFSGVYALALAIYLKYDRIRLYGMDMTHTEEYRYQRESYAFWVGYAGGKGIDLEIYGAESIFNRPLYGYDICKEKSIMKFTVNDRLQLLSILPEKADLVSMKMLSEFKSQLGFSEEEITKLGLYTEEQKDKDGKVSGLLYHYDATKDEGKEIEVGEATRKVVLASFEILDKKGEFTEALLKVYEQFSFGNA
jgi:hypothetical protein